MSAAHSGTPEECDVETEAEAKRKTGYSTKYAADQRVILCDVDKLSGTRNAEVEVEVAYGCQDGMT